MILHTTQFNAKKGDSFYIPPKNYYNLINQKAREAELSLIQLASCLSSLLARVGSTSAEASIYALETSLPALHPRELHVVFRRLVSR